MLRRNEWERLVISEGRRTERTSRRNGDVTFRFVARNQLGGKVNLNFPCSSSVRVLTLIILDMYSAYPRADIHVHALSAP